jgi:hypothetical protein
LTAFAVYNESIPGTVSAPPEMKISQFVGAEGCAKVTQESSIEIVRKAVFKCLPTL